MQVQNAFQEILCLRSILSNYDIIFVQRPGQKRGVRNDIFWSERGSGEPCSSPPPRIPRSSPLPPGLKPYQVLKTSCCFCFSTHVKNKRIEDSLRIEQNWNLVKQNLPSPSLCIVSTSDDTTHCGI